MNNHIHIPCQTIIRKTCDCYDKLFVLTKKSTLDQKKREGGGVFYFERYFNFHFDHTYPKSKKIQVFVGSLSDFVGSSLDCLHRWFGI